MIRVKDAQKSLKFYQDVLGMELLRSNKNPSAGFDLYFLGYPGHQTPSKDGSTSKREAMLELTWNYGTEKDDNFQYHNGNEDPKGFGHLGITVDNVEAACERLEKLGVEFKKKPQDGKMKNVAFVFDPDKYWIEIVQNERVSGKANFPNNEA
jgi:lactoylglutathione lyase